MVTARTQTWQLLVLRLVVHPAIWGIVTALFSHTLQHIGARRRADCGTGMPEVCLAALLTTAHNAHSIHCCQTCMHEKAPAT